MIIDKTFRQEHNLIDSRLVTAKVGLYDEPLSLITVDIMGEFFVWDVQEEQCIHRISIMNNIDSNILSKQSTMIAMQIYESNEGQLLGHFGYTTCLRELYVLDFEFSINEEKGNLSHFAAGRTTQICKLKGSDPMALSFIHAQNRICILVTNTDICVIDCLQKHIVKKISTEASILDRNMNFQPLMKAAIAFPYVGILSDGAQSILRYEVDSIFALVGAMDWDGAKEEDESTTSPSNSYQSLLMDEMTKTRWFGCIDEGTGRKRTCLLQKDFNNRSNYMKSSGYGVLGPKMKLGSAPSLLKQAQTRKASKVKKAKKLREDVKLKACYPTTCDLLDCHQQQHDDIATQSLISPIATLTYSPFGEYLATSHNNAIVHVFKLPFAKYKSASRQISETHPCSVEDKKVQSTCRPSWSTNDTSGKKYLAHHNKIYCLSPNAKSMSIVCELEKDVTNATFFSRNECMLSTKANQISLHRLLYHGNNIDKTTKAISIRPLYETNVKQANHGTFTFDSQRITSIASVNGSMTNLVGCSCSNKTLHIIDVVQNKVLWSKTDCAGSRPAHSIAFPQPSQNCLISSESYNLLIAASTDNGGLLSLYDLRCKNVVQTFHGHVNRKDQCMSTFSPCVRYVAVGGEGLCGSASLYDLRGNTSSPMNTELGFNKQKCSPFRDGTVTDCQFNPIHPQLVTGSLSGQLRWYTERKT